jgi:pantoate--beta-alanine ligase
MEIINRIPRMTSIGRDLRSQGKRIGLVPTNGSLHEGHLSLTTRAHELCDTVVISIVPAQSAVEGSENPPANLARDAELAFTRGVDFIFAPAANDVFPERFLTRVTVEGLSEKLEGVGRPGYLAGVTTAVAKMLNIVHPHFVLLGRKNAQQVVAVKRMVRELAIDVEIVVCPTVREEDGLAVASNNASLSTEARKAAIVLRRALERCRSLSNSSERDAARLIGSMRAMLEAEPLARIDYIAISDTKQLNDLDVISSDSPALVSIAAYIGDTRLTDNIVLNGEL